MLHPMVVAKNECAATAMKTPKEAMRPTMCSAVSVLLAENVPKTFPSHSTSCAFLRCASLTVCVSCIRMFANVGITLRLGEQSSSRYQDRLVGFV